MIQARLVCFFLAASILLAEWSCNAAEGEDKISKAVEWINKSRKSFSFDHEEKNEDKFKDAFGDNQEKITGKTTTTFNDGLHGFEVKRIGDKWIGVIRSSTDKKTASWRAEGELPGEGESYYWGREFTANRFELTMSEMNPVVEIIQHGRDQFTFDANPEVWFIKISPSDDTPKTPITQESRKVIFKATTTGSLPPTVGDVKVNEKTAKNPDDFRLISTAEEIEKWLSQEGPPAKSNSSSIELPMASENAAREAAKVITRLIVLCGGKISTE